MKNQIMCLLNGVMFQHLADSLYPFLMSIPKNSTHASAVVHKILYLNQNLPFYSNLSTLSNTPYNETMAHLKI
jgi:hypothetical protein